MTVNADVTDPERELYEHLIDRYRDLIVERYDFADMNSRLTLPPALTPEVVGQVRDYFLKSLYPDAKERARLEEAMQTLGSFLSKPSKIWRLMGNMASAVFKFGRLFPKALKAGYKGLQAYLDAKDFERDLQQAATELGQSKPLSKDDFDKCLARIPRKNAEKFMKDVLAVFELLTNSDLVSKTMEIMQNVIRKMKSYPHIYTPDDIEGIELGVNILKHGYDVFSPMSPSTKELVIEYISRNEMWFLDDIYSK